MTFSWTFPYPSRRMPILARNAVATSQPLAAQAGLQILSRGGNAVDAALATAITLTVVEPTSNGIGSDAFAMVWDGKSLYGINGSGRSPAAWSPTHFAGLSCMPTRGWDSVTIPGAVDVWASLSRRFGKIPFADLFESAIRYATDGFLVSPITAEKWSQAPPIFKDYPNWASTFLPHGRLPLPGEIFRPPGFAKTLRILADTHGESLYRGELASLIVSHAQQNSGAISLDDLAAHHSEWVEPLSLDWHGVTLHELPPNGQGLTVLVALGILQHLPIDGLPVDSPDSIHLQIEAMKKAFSATIPNIADPPWMRVKPSSLLDKSFLLELARTIRIDRASDPISALPSDGGTVYLTAADQSGMMVSYIQSNYKGFGSGIVIPGTGISLQNRGAGFTLNEKHPNAVAGRKRPYHTIIPGFVTKEGAALMSFGVMGAHMQAQGHLQMMLRVFAGGQNPQAAADAPRWYLSEDSSLAIEPGFGPSIVNELQRRGHCLSPHAPASLFGGAQMIYCLPDGYCAASDPRKDGQAVGF